jgi:hypothetical protein
MDPEQVLPLLGVADHETRKNQGLRGGDRFFGSKAAAEFRGPPRQISTLPGLLAALQNQLVPAQIERHGQCCPTCRRCGRPFRGRGSYPVTFHSLFGDVPVRVRRFRFCVVVNAGSSTEALFSVSGAGELSFLNSAGSGATPLDTALSRDSLFLYTLNASAGSISEFRLDESSRTLTLLGTVSDGLRGNAALNGLTAR